MSNKSAKSIKDIHKEATSALKKAVETIKQSYNRFKIISINYKVGNLVWLDATNI